MGGGAAGAAGSRCPLVPQHTKNMAVTPEDVTQGGAAAAERALVGHVRGAGLRGAGAAGAAGGAGQPGGAAQPGLGAAGAVRQRLPGRRGRAPRVHVQARLRCAPGPGLHLRWGCAAASRGEGGKPSSCREPFCCPCTPAFVLGLRRSKPRECGEPSSCQKSFCCSCTPAFALGLGHGKPGEGGKWSSCWEPLCCSCTPA